TLNEAKNFEEAKQKANNLHFLAIQSNPESESFAGFWLLQEGSQE
ncbi:MAG: Tab2/Atab2 family RNA-binding protein, partial [Microcystis sp. M53601_WE4]|nr:Tab2/Atab2 family RNA-binding protein [Microcystis sp. M53601_WE4]